ncbi:MAG: MFS transporter [archaeon]|nr:MFS transporter [archaeon]
MAEDLSLRDNKDLERKKFANFGKCMYIYAVSCISAILANLILIFFINFILIVAVLLSLKAIKKTEPYNKDENFSQFWMKSLISVPILISSLIFITFLWDYFNILFANVLFAIFFGISSILNFSAWKSLGAFFNLNQNILPDTIGKKAYETIKVFGKGPILVYSLYLLNTIGDLFPSQIIDIDTSFFLNVLFGITVLCFLFFFFIIGLWAVKLGWVILNQKTGISLITDEYYTRDFTKMVNYTLFNTLGFFFLDYIIPIFTSQTIGASGLEMGIMFAVQTLGGMISSIFGGFLTDRVDRKSKIILFSSVGRGISYFFVYISFLMNSLLGITIGLFCLGFIGGLFWIAMSALVAEKSNKKHRSQAYGARDLVMGIGMALGAFIGFTFYLLGTGTSLIPTDMFGTWIFNTPIMIYFGFVVFGILNFYGGIKFYRNVDESIKFHDKSLSLNNEHKEKGENSDNQPNNSKIRQIISLIPKKMLFGLILLLTLIFLASINGRLARPFINVYIIEHIVADPFLATLIYLPSAASIILSPQIGKLVDKVHPGLGLSSISILGSLLTWFLINTNNPILFSIILFFDICLGTAAGLIFQNFMSRITIEHRGKIMGLTNVFGNFGGIIGPLIGGLVWDLSHQFTFIITIFVELSLIPLLFGAIYLLIPFMEESYENLKKKKSNKLK